MSLAPPLEHAAEAATDPRISVAEARLVMLRELAKFGLSRVSDLERHARPGEHPADAFCRISRAIRCAIILQMRIEAELAALSRRIGKCLTPMT